MADIQPTYQMIAMSVVRVALHHLALDCAQCVISAWSSCYLRQTEMCECYADEIRREIAEQEAREIVAAETPASVAQVVTVIMPTAKMRGTNETN